MEKLTVKSAFYAIKTDTGLQYIKEYKIGKIEYYVI